MINENHIMIILHSLLWAFQLESLKFIMTPRSDYDRGRGGRRAEYG